MGQSDRELAAFCERHHARLIRIVTAYVGDSGTAEELVQDTLVKVCRDWKRVKHMGNADAWVTTVALNSARSWFRRSYAGRRATRRLATRQVEPHQPDQADGIAVLEALKQLPHRQRQAVILRFLEDRTVDEVAQVMECSPGTVKTHTSRALASLRSMGLGLDLPARDHAGAASGESPTTVSSDLRPRGG